MGELVLIGIAFIIAAYMVCTCVLKLSRFIVNKIFWR